jgi:hypothetical protein
MLLINFKCYFKKYNDCKLAIQRIDSDVIAQYFSLIKFVLSRRISYKLFASEQQVLS